jgi:hypothetical protein
LIWKIWKASKKGINNTVSKQLQLIVRILMESGILYFIISITHFSTWFGHSTFAIHLLGTMVGPLCDIGSGKNAQWI